MTGGAQFIQWIACCDTLVMWNCDALFMGFIELRSFVSLSELVTPSASFLQGLQFLAALETMSLNSFFGALHTFPFPLVDGDKEVGEEQGFQQSQHNLHPHASL
ncbi:hypothetical protein Sjap_021855 [Stephania japonica]|uniref:Uncharacterized protein n=1 Tax=Stephania japonica TaxID=461633 RepID=A0AAP0HPC5_9MAGN